jgi:superfamily II DNA or RNA helicase
MKGIISVVTGGGKTIFAIHLIEYIKREYPNAKIVVIVPTTQLKDQWTAQIKIHTIHTIGSKLNNLPTCDIIICTNLHAQKNNNSINSKNTFIIYDECHRYGTEKNKIFLNNDYKATLGLTATLERLYDEGVQDYLIPYIGQVIYNYNLKQAIHDKVIVPFVCQNIKVPITEDDQEKILKLNRLITIANQQNDEDKVKKLLLIRKRIHNNSPYRSALAIKLILENLLIKKIVFCEEIKQANFIHEYLNIHKNLNTAIYHSGLTKSQRIAFLSGFLQSRYHTLITVKGLDEGFDVPDIEMGIIVSASNTNRQRIQRLGRTLRLSEGKTSAKVFTLYTSESEKEVLLKNEVYSENEEFKTIWEQYTFK